MKKQWTQPIGFAHALFEVAADALSRAKSLKPGDVREAVAATNLQTVVGPVKWGGQGPFRNVSKTPLVLGQWVKGSGKYKYDLVIVNNEAFRQIPAGGQLKTYDFKFRPDFFSSVAFWYQTHPHAPFPPLPEELLPLGKPFGIPQIAAGQVRRDVEPHGGQRLPPLLPTRRRTDGLCRALRPSLALCGVRARRQNVPVLRARDDGRSAAATRFAERMRWAAPLS